MTHYEEDITIAAGTTYPSGGLPIIVTKGTQVVLVDHVTQKAVSSAPGVGISSNALGWQAVLGSESGQAFRLRAYMQSGAGSGFLSTEITNGSALVAGVPLHVSYEG